MTLCIGLMSGTSLDGVDGVLVAFETTPGFAMQVLGHAHRALPAALKAELLALNTPGENELHRAALAANALVAQYAATVATLLERSGVSVGEVAAIGAHGQTVRHRPGEFDGIGYTLQLNAPALLAELTGIDVVADFRSRDVAAGGSGAPLVPAFHEIAFAQPGSSIAVLNVGGISNLTVLGAHAPVGFDCGPGNALMDFWCERHTGQPFDQDGRWGATGQVLEALLASMLAEPYFALAPPKSTGRDLFNVAWLDRHLARAGATGSGPSSPGSLGRPEDVQATLAELTARVCADAARARAPGARRLLVCGGGALNAELMRRLALNLSGWHVDSTASSGIAPLQVEGCAFAWLAMAFIERRAGNVVSATGARGSRVLGALYPAGVPRALRRPLAPS